MLQVSGIYPTPFDHPTIVVEKIKKFSLPFTVIPESVQEDLTSHPG
jgi:hypothetical protein